MYGMNLTPMMDLTFLLLITFIITFPIMERGIPVNLPRSAANPANQSDKPLQITLDKEGRCYLGTELIAPESLRLRFENAVAANPEIRLILRGDFDASYGKMVEIAALAKQLGINSLSLATKELEAAAQPQRNQKAPR
jgi:Biopolymer transport protein